MIHERQCKQLLVRQRENTEVLAKAGLLRLLRLLDSKKDSFSRFFYVVIIGG